MDIFFISIIVFIVIFSIVTHELAHGYTAYYFGDPTPFVAGRLTFNPLKHMDPVGSVIVPGILALLGGFIFGWAKPVPYNPYNLNNRSQQLLVVLAGVISNFLLAIIAALLIRYLAFDPFSATYMLLYLTVFINIILGLFNLMPFPGFDGSKALALILPLEYGRRLESLESKFIFSGLTGLILILLLLFIFLDPFISFVSYISKLLIGI